MVGSSRHSVSVLSQTLPRGALVWNVAPGLIQLIKEKPQPPPSFCSKNPAVKMTFKSLCSSCFVNYCSFNICKPVCFEPVLLLGTPLCNLVSHFPCVLCLQAVPTSPSSCSSGTPSPGCSNLTPHHVPFQGSIPPALPNCPPVSICIVGCIVYHIFVSSLYLHPLCNV